MGNAYTPQANRGANQELSLGPKIAAYLPRKKNLMHVAGIFLSVVLFLASLIFFTLRFSEMVFAIRSHGRAMVLLHAPTLLLILTLLPVAGITIFLTVINWNNHLTLYKFGFFMRQGATEVVWYWKTTTRLDTRITHIRFGASIVDIRIRLLVGNRQEKLLIHNRYENMTDLIQRTRQLLLPIMTRWAQKKLNQNIPIEFHHKLVGTRQGLIINGEQIGWEKIEPPKIKNQKLYLFEDEQQKKIFQANLNSITNLDLLIHLLNNPTRLPINLRRGSTSFAADEAQDQLTGHEPAREPSA